MTQISVIISVDLAKHPEIEPVQTDLESKGLEVREVTVRPRYARILGSAEGNIERFNSDGVVCEREGWKGML